MAKFLISEEQKRQMHDITVITVLRSTIKALDKAISWWTEVDQKKKGRNYAIENRHARRSKERKVLEWSKQTVSGYALTGNIPEYPVGKSSFSSQVLQITVNFGFRLRFHCQRTLNFPRLWKNQIQSKDVVSNTFRQLSWSISLNYGNGRREIESEICWKSDYSDRGIQRNWWRSSQRIW